MIPILFPNTYLSGRLMRRLEAVFARIGVYLPSDLDIPMQMQRWAESGLVEMRVPVAAGKQRLAAVLKAFRSWASMQSGQPGVDLNLLRAFHGQTPFLDAPFASQIRTDIQRQMTGSSPDSSGQDSQVERLFNAQVFLSIAQQLDEQADTLDRDYSAVDQHQQNLLRELQPDQPPSHPVIGEPTGMQADDHGQFMLPQRLQAWALLAAADPALSGTNAPALFVTGSREVLEWMVERLPESAAFDRLTGVRVPVEAGGAMRDWRQAFLPAMIELAARRREHVDLDAQLPAPPPVAPGQAGALLEAVRFPGEHITDLLGLVPTAPSADPSSKIAAESTIVIALSPDAG